MTVAVAVKVYDGLVLAADSATTAMLSNGGAQVYNNANKIVHMHRAYPIGLMTWGTGSLGPASIEALAKDLRVRLMGDSAEHPNDALAGDYTVEGVARFVADAIHEVHINKTRPGDDVESPGLAIAGYDGSGESAELWVINAVDRETVPQVEKVIGADQHGWIAFAQDEAARRLFTGYDPQLPYDIRQVLDDTEWQKVAPVFDDGRFLRQPAVPFMPFADAIGLAKFLVDTTVGYSRFLPGPDTVGGPTEVAGITRHEGFKWVARKHFYSHELNPREFHDHQGH